MTRLLLSAIRILPTPTTVWGWLILGRAFRHGRMLSFQRAIGLDPHFKISRDKLYEQEQHGNIKNR